MLNNMLIIDGSVKSTVDDDYDAYSVIWDELEEMGIDEVDIERADSFDSLNYRLFFNKKSDMNLFKLLTKAKVINYVYPWGGKEVRYVDVYQYYLNS